jgi:hypothetical protein
MTDVAASVRGTARADAGRHAKRPGRPDNLTV